MKHSSVLTFENVILRPLDHSDIEILRNWRNDKNNSKYLTPMPFVTPEMQNDWYNRYLNDLDTYTFAIDETKILRKFVGSISLYNFNGNEAEIGKILVGDENAHGLHVGENAIKAIMEIGKSQFNLNQFVLHVYKNNLPAFHIYEKIGFSIVDEKKDDEDNIEYCMKYSI